MTRDGLRRALVANNGKMNTTILKLYLLMFAFCKWPLSLLRAEIKLWRNLEDLDPSEKQVRDSFTAQMQREIDIIFQNDSLPSSALQIRRPWDSP
jgi:hypothetical protein